MRWTRRTLWLALVVLATLALAVVARRRVERAIPAPSVPPRWPPFDAAPSAPAAVTPASAARAAAAPGGEPEPVAPRWVLPVDGGCPPGYPIKANDNSGIFHMPGGRSYERTKAERCYVDAESAAADGYRAAKA